MIVAMEKLLFQFSGHLLPGNQEFLVFTELFFRVLISLFDQKKKVFPNSDDNLVSIFDFL